jgi:hypothetical protein
MGLDQYAYIDPKEGARHANQRKEDTFYWRKHSRLHEFMLSIWMEQNPDKSREMFNCRDLYLSELDLLELERALENNFDDYASEGGLFWGHQYQEEQVEEYAEQDLNFVQRALDAVREGKFVVYSCWW